MKTKDQYLQKKTEYDQTKNRIQHLASQLQELPGKKRTFENELDAAYAYGTQAEVTRYKSKLAELPLAGNLRQDLDDLKAKLPELEKSFLKSKKSYQVEASQALKKQAETALTHLKAALDMQDDVLAAYKQANSVLDVPGTGFRYNLPRGANIASRVQKLEKAVKSL